MQGAATQAMWWHRRGAATPQMPARRRAPPGCGPQARWLRCSLLTYRSGYARRSRLASGPGGQQQNVHLISCRALTVLAHGRRSGARRGRRLLQILVIPRQIALQPIPHVTWPRDAVILVGINHELRIDAKAPQCLVHLLATLNRDIKIALAAQKQRR